MHAFDATSLPLTTLRARGEEPGIYRGRLAPNLVLLRVVGFGYARFASAIIQTFHSEVDLDQRPGLALDFGDMPSYDSALRRDLTEWWMGIRTRCEQPRILTGSKMVAMGVSVANLALGGVLQVFSDRGRFDEAVEALARLRQSAPDEPREAAIDTR